MSCATKMHDSDHLTAVYMDLSQSTQLSTQLKNSLLVIGTKIHTLRNGESETQQGFI